MEYKIDLDMQSSGFRTELEFGTLEISGDVTYGFRPFQLMAASVAGCSGGILRKIMKKQRLDVANIRIQSRIVRDGRDVNRIEKLHIHFVISGKNLKADKVQKAVDLGYKYCSMVQSVKDCIIITESFEIVPTWQISLPASGISQHFNGVGHRTGLRLVELQAAAQTIGDQHVRVERRDPVQQPVSQNDLSSS